jgi:hypothetical protein
MTLLTSRRTRTYRKTRKSGYGVPSTSGRSDSGSSSGSGPAGFTSTSDEDDNLDDSVSILSSGDEEVDYSFRYREASSTPAGTKLRLASTPRSSSKSTPAIQLPTPSAQQTSLSQTSRLKIGLSRRSTLGYKGGLAVREDEWERWERISREQVMVCPVTTD